MIRANVFSAAVVALLLGGSAAALQAQGIQNPPAANLVAANTLASNPTGISSSEPQLEQRYPMYIIQRQDVLKLSFPLSPEMNQT
ncbi:MAG: hypothetical protein WA324_14820, partial [Bryobacteraceae bacterium]